VGDGERLLCLCTERQKGQGKKEDFQVAHSEMVIR
jgi:hypothetical protein